MQPWVTATLGKIEGVAPLPRTKQALKLFIVYGKNWRRGSIDLAKRNLVSQGWIIVYHCKLSNENVLAWILKSTA